MQHIIIPTDFSNESLAIISRGKELAQKLNKGILLLYIIDYNQYANIYQEQVEVSSIPFAPIYEELRDAAIELFNQHSEVIKTSVDSSIHVEFKIKSGVFAQVLSDESQSENAFLILLSKGKEEGFLTRFFYNTNAEIVSETSCPVLVIPEPSVPFSFTKIVYATNYHEEDVPTMKRLALIGSIFQSSITALHIDKEANFNNLIIQQGFIDELKEKIDYKDLQIEVVQGYNPVEEIIKYAKHHNVDLIVLLKENKGFLKELFSTSTTKNLIEHSKIPVLVFHQKKITHEHQ